MRARTPGARLPSRLRSLSLTLPRVWAGEGAELAPQRPCTPHRVLRRPGQQRRRLQRPLRSQQPVHHGRPCHLHGLPHVHPDQHHALWELGPAGVEQTDSTRKPNEDPAHPPLPGRLSPLYRRSPNTRSRPSLLWELGHFFTQHCRRRPHSTAHPHLGPERVSLPYFTQDHVVGALFPPPALHPDLGLTSSVTGVSGPDSCGPGGELGGMGGAAATPPGPLAPVPPLCLSPVGRQS